MLDDGRLVMLAGLYLDSTAAQSLTGRQLRLLPVEEPDRWGHVLVLAFDGDLLQAQLLADGLAAVWPLRVPASLPPGCAAEFARAEAAARAEGKGLWGRPGLRFEASDPQAVLARNGRFAIVEGRVESLGKARDTRYLNFGGRWATDFTVTFSSSIEGQLAAKGMDPARMEGARVRVRGVVLEKDGPHIEVADPAQIQWAN
ncbi:thermonuclease family protein [Pannonibacter carbonis]|uniref:thermonuclease family protein n=1 Tax=Pannonibacter carbonis TaxID=2067569 RepID=UPI00130024A2|nr:thermonuclease family protein [Pannonibacter carbonis]